MSIAPLIIGTVEADSQFGGTGGKVLVFTAYSCCGDLSAWLQ